MLHGRPVTGCYPNFEGHCTEAHAGLCLTVCASFKKETVASYSKVIWFSQHDILFLHRILFAELQKIILICYSSYNIRCTCIYFFIDVIFLFSAFLGCIFIQMTETWI